MSGLLQFLEWQKHNVNARNNAGETPLYLAITHRNVKAVEWLLDAKADPRIPDKNGTTCLQAARAMVTKRNDHSVESKTDANEDQSPILVSVVILSLIEDAVKNNKA